MLLTSLLACRDAALIPYSDALGAFEHGREHLAAGAAGAAAADFAEARGHDPRSPALVLWEAKARADAGETERAVALLDDLLATDPGLGLAHYNRAAYRARLGRLDDAAIDLAAALQAEVASPYAAAADPDFAPHRTARAFSGLLPAQPAIGRVSGPEGAVWVGSKVELKLVIESLATSPLAVHREGADPGCLRLDQIVEDDVEQADVRLREVTLRMTALGPCTATVGPFVVTAEGVPVSLGSVGLVVEGPPGFVGEVGSLPADLPVPSTLAPAGSALRVERTPGGTIAMGPLDAALRGDGKAPLYRLEWRMRGQTRAVGGYWSGDVTVRSGKGTASPEGG